VVKKEKFDQAKQNNKRAWLAWKYLALFLDVKKAKGNEPNN